MSSQNPTPTPQLSPNPNPTRSRSRRSSSSHPNPIDDSPYPADMPSRPQLNHSRTGSSSVSIHSLSKEEIRDREYLINMFEAEEEMIMNKLSRRLDELRQHTHSLSQTHEVESESIVNRLQRQLRVVEGQLALAVQSQSRSQSQSQSQSQSLGGSRSSTPSSPVIPRNEETGMSGRIGGGSVPAPLPGQPQGLGLGVGGGMGMGIPNAVGLQTFLSGSDPVLMGNLVEQMRSEKAEMQRQMDSLSSENDRFRQELIDLRSRLRIPVDDLVGLPSKNTSSSSSSRYQPVGVAQQSSNGGAQPIPFSNNNNRRERSERSTSNNNNNSNSTYAHVPPSVPAIGLSHLNNNMMGVGGPSSPYTSASTTSTSSPSEPAYSNPETNMTSVSSSYGYSVPPPPQNTLSTLPQHYLPQGRVVHQPGTGGIGVGGHRLDYPLAPPPSLSTSLASTTFVSPVNSPTQSRRPSVGNGRVAETGTFARGRVESFGTTWNRERERAERERDRSAGGGTGGSSAQGMVEEEEDE